MSFTQAQLDAIHAAIASGELTVSYNGRTVTYRSMGDLIKARDLIKQELAASNGSSGSSLRYTLGATSKG